MDIIGGKFSAAPDFNALATLLSALAVVPVLCDQLTNRRRRATSPYRKTSWTSLDIQHAYTDWEHSLHGTSLDIQHADTDWEHSLHATSLDIQHAETDWEHSLHGTTKFVKTTAANSCKYQSYHPHLKYDTATHNFPLHLKTIDLSFLWFSCMKE